MKTTGYINWFHALAWLAKHLEDAMRQGRFKEAEAARKLERKLWKMRRSVERKLQRKVATTVKSVTETKVSKEVSIAEEDAKFPPIGLGCILCLEQPEGPLQPGERPLDVWVRRGFGQLGEVMAWKETLLQWHAGYLSSKFERFRDGSVDGELDERLIEGTATTPRWDSDSLSEALHAAEISKQDFIEFIERIARRFKAEEHRISCGAARKLRLIGVNVHPQDGTLHLHPLFLRTEPIGFLRSDGTIVPASKAPKRGRRKKSEGWIGGERAGLLGDGGRLVTNSLGVALSAAANERATEIDPPRERGNDWHFLENAIRERETGEYIEGGKRGKRKRAQGLGRPYDLRYTEILREEFQLLAARFPAFAARRLAKIEAAKAARRELNAALIAFAQPEIDAAAAAGVQRGRDAERARLEIEKAKPATKESTVVRTEKIDAPFLTRLAALQKRLLERELPNAEEIALLTPKANAVAEFSIRPDLFLAVFELLNDRELRLLAEAVVDLQQAMSAPMLATQVYNFADAAVLRRLKGKPARRGDERYLTPEFIAEAKASPHAANDFLESLALLASTTTDEQPRRVEVEPQVPGDNEPQHPSNGRVMVA